MHEHRRAEREYTCTECGEVFQNIFPFQAHQRDVHQVGGVRSEKQLEPQKHSQNEQGQRVKYGLLCIIVKQITEIFLTFYRGLNIVRPEPESVFACKPG